MSKKVELSEKEKSLQARHAAAKAAGAKVAIIIEIDGLEKVIYCKEPHRKNVGLYYNACESDMVEANYNLIRSCAIPTISDMDVFKDADSSTYLAVCSHVGKITELIEVKKSTSLTL